tara:strand:+ start:791 stop:1135 length:345 start_codon:yes stop_codon:yes gene_type:complete
MKKIIVDATGIQKEVDLTPEEIKYNEEQNKIWEDGKYDRTINNLRLARNSLLLKSDWTDLPNAPLTDEKKLEWQNYRNQLRDITEGLNTIKKIETKMKVENGKFVNFPTQPSED